MRKTPHPRLVRQAKPRTATKKAPARNYVAEAIEQLGGPTPTSHAARVSAAAIYQWRTKGFVPDAKAAILLSRATRIPVEYLAWRADDPNRPEPPGGQTNGEGGIRTRGRDAIPTHA